MMVRRLRSWSLNKIFLITTILLLAVGTFNFAYASRDQAVGIDWFKVITDMFAGETSARSTGATFFSTSLLDIGLWSVTGCTVDGWLDALYKDVDSCNPSFFQTGTAGSNNSILAYGSRGVQGFMETPPPVNTAYYFESLKDESLLFKSTYAQSNVIDPFVAVLSAWRGMRNIAYGMLAVFVMTTAVLITLRKKVDAQTVVTAQMALPRIFISAVLITFSYPLGSFFAQLIIPATKIGIWALGAGAFQGGLSGNQAGFTTTQCPSLIGSAIIRDFTQMSTCLTEAAANNTFGNAGVGAALALDFGTVLLFALAVVLYVVIIFGALIVLAINFLKLLLRTIFAPIIFAVAAIPGQEGRIVDWFKDQLSASLALAVTMFCLMLGGSIALTTPWGASPIPGTDSYISTSLRGFMGTFIMVIMGMVALKAPSMLDAAIKGPKKK